MLKQHYFKSLISSCEGLETVLKHLFKFSELLSAGRKKNKKNFKIGIC